MAEEKELKELCLVECCPYAGRHSKEEHDKDEPDDYAVLAAKEWLGEPFGVRYPSCSCHHCESARVYYAKQVPELAAVIRKHAGPMIERHCNDAGC